MRTVPTCGAFRIASRLLATRAPRRWPTDVCSLRDTLHVRPSEETMTDRTPRTTRRRLLAAAAVVTLSPPRVVFAQTYPTKPVRWIVPYPPGGGSDFLARTVGAQMEKQLGQPFVIEHRPGAATMIGAEGGASGTADC